MKNTKLQKLISEGKLIKATDMYDRLPEESKKRIQQGVLEIKLLYKIREARERAGLTQQQLSDISGIPQASISKIEAGKRNIEINTLLKIATSLGKELEIEFK